MFQITFGNQMCCVIVVLITDCGIQLPIQHKRPQSIDVKLSCVLRPCLAQMRQIDVVLHLIGQGTARNIDQLCGFQTLNDIQLAHFQIIHRHRKRHADFLNRCGLFGGGKD